jgi:hypothetical protein
MQDETSAAIDAAAEINLYLDAVRFLLTLFARN